MKPQYLVVTGSVGAGATTLAKLIADEWASETLLEAAIEETNPFFGSAQSDPHRWMFHSQVHFLAASAARHEVLRGLMSTGINAIVEDRTPFEHHGAYSRAYRDQGVLDSREFELLETLAMRFEQDFESPDLLIYRDMSSEQLVSRVQERNRAGESFDPGRLSAIHVAFEEFIHNWDRSPLIRISHDIDVLTVSGINWVKEQLTPFLGPPTS